MHIGAILPTIKLYGGVKRFLELGNVFHEMGHRVSVYTPEGAPPDWFAYRGTVGSFADLNTATFDGLFVTERALLPHLLAANARHKAFYHVLKSEPLREVLAHPEVTVYANSSGLREYDRKRYGVDAVAAYGGVDCARYTPRAEVPPGGTLTIMTYGRLGARRKGTRFVVRACERLYRRGHDIRLLLFDSPVSEAARRRITEFRCDLPFEFVVDHPVLENNELYHRADVFAVAEKNAGWSNTCAEAMAAGVPVVATRSGTQDFLRHEETGLVVHRFAFSVEHALRRLIASPELRSRLAAAGRAEIEKFDWRRLAETILNQVGPAVST